MHFNSYSYLLLLFLTVVLFWNLPVQFRHAYVLILSVLFYASWNVYFLIIPVIMCVIVFFSAVRFGREDRWTARPLGGGRELS